MFNVHVTWTTMELLPLVCLCLLTWSGTTFADEPLIINVREGSDVTLPCSFSTTKDISTEIFEWKKDGEKDVFLYDGSPLSGQDPQFKGRVSHSEEELMNGNASITITKTKVADAGDYTCYFPSIHLEHHMKLRVGTVSKPIITLGETKDGVQLQCVVHASTFKPHVQWQDTAGNELSAVEIQGFERGGIIILSTTVTKTDHYRCVATQEEISHQVYTETHVTVPFTHPETQAGWIVAAIVASVGAAVVGAVVVTLLVVGAAFLWLKKGGCIILDYRKKMSPDPASQEPETSVPLNGSSPSAATV